MQVSVVITSYNEGDEVKATIDSVRKNTSDVEIVLVDDGSTDNSCIGVDCDQLVRHEERVGIAPSRLDAVAVARGNCFSFLDAHQRVSEGCLNKCADLAVERQAIVWPDVMGLGKSRWMGHGASMTQKDGKKKGLFDGRWKRSKSLDLISRCSTMIVPGYTIPRNVWPKVELINGLRMHGASEPAITVKAFFAEVDILHLCGPLARHYFREGHHLPYSCSWKTTARNHALVARVCFSGRVWRKYWAPKVFRRHLRDGLKEFDLEHITSQHIAFQKIKRRPDEEFWYGLMGTAPPWKGD